MNYVNSRELAVLPRNVIFYTVFLLSMNKTRESYRKLEIHSCFVFF